MSGFSVFALLLLVATTVFALYNSTPVPVRFLMWEVQTSLALAVIGGVVLGGFLVFVSSVMGQQHLRARLRDLQARLRDAEAKLPSSAERPENRPPENRP